MRCFGCVRACFSDGRVCWTKLVSNFAACLCLICMHKGLKVHIEVTRAVCVPTTVAASRPRCVTLVSLAYAFFMVFVAVGVVQPSVLMSVPKCL